jgi:hypothetical protein
MYNDRNTEIIRKITHMYRDSLTLRVLAYISSHDPDLSYIRISAPALKWNIVRPLFT